MVETRHIVVTAIFGVLILLSTASFLYGGDRLDLAPCELTEVINVDCDVGITSCRVLYKEKKHTAFIRECSCSSCDFLYEEGGVYNCGEHDGVLLLSSKTEIVIKKEVLSILALISAVFFLITAYLNWLDYRSQYSSL
jgi:hypothetical protein